MAPQIAASHFLSNARNIDAGNIFFFFGSKEAPPIQSKAYVPMPSVGGRKGFLKTIIELLVVLVVSSYI